MLSRAVDILRLSCVFTVLQPDDGLSHYSTPGHILGPVCKNTPTFPAFYTIYPPFYPLHSGGYRPRYSKAVFHFIHIPYDDE